jgi:hypothetical protein
MDTIPEFVIKMWEAELHNEMYPERPLKTVLLTSSDLIWLESSSKPVYTKKPEKARVSEPLRIQNVGSKVLYF